MLPFRLQKETSKNVVDTTFNFFLFPFFLYFHKTVPEIRVRNDTTESHKEKRPVLMLIFSTVSQKSRD